MRLHTLQVPPLISPLTLRLTFAMVSPRFSTLFFLALGLMVSAAPQGPAPKTVHDLSPSPLSGDVDGGVGATLDATPDNAGYSYYSRDYAEKYGRESGRHEQFSDYSDEKLGVSDIIDGRHEHGYRPRSYAEQYGYTYDHERPVDYSYESMRSAVELQTRRPVKRQEAADYGYNNEGYYGGYEYKSDCHGHYRRVYFSETHGNECEHVLQGV
ncbi:hypothetical protein PENSPDRAFT_65580 [Peniophora sp. CONT]|nr:hypothetical protein PENSPDRAFT_65580 [Peniophora sp. CONT]